MKPSLDFVLYMAACCLLFQGCEKQAPTPKETTPDPPTAHVTTPPVSTTPTTPPVRPSFKTRDMIVSAELVSIIKEHGAEGLQERLEQHLENREWVKSFEVSSRMVSYRLEDEDSTYHVQIP